MMNRLVKKYKLLRNMSIYDHPKWMLTSVIASKPLTAGSAYQRMANPYKVMLLNGSDDQR